MKKYIFLVALAALLTALILRSWGLALGFGSALFIWIAYENFLRTRFRFLQARRGVNEVSFDLGADPAQIEVAWDGSCALFVTVDGMMSMRDLRGRELWKRPMEPRTKAHLAIPGGICYYAVDDELVRTDERGAVFARLSFSPPPFLQSYRLLLNSDRKQLLLHTPWFLQFAEADLGALGSRISCEETGHYLKYCALSPDGDRVFFAGAKLLEEEQSTEARWGCWRRDAGVWSPAWAQAVESYANSHLRGLALSQDGSALVLELHHQGYESRVMDLEGTLLWRRDGAEHPRLSPNASLMIWESSLEGLTLSEMTGKKKLWNWKSEGQIRHKTVMDSGDCLVVEGRRVVRFNRDGHMAWEAWFQTDPFRLEASSDGKILALVRQNKGAMLQLPVT